MTDRPFPACKTLRIPATQAIRRAEWMLTLPEAAVLLGINYNTLFRQVQEGNPPVRVVKSGRLHMVRQGDLDRVLAKRKRSA